MRIVVSSDPRQRNERYRGALLCAGAMPEEVVVVMPGDPLPDGFDGLLIAGGSDVEPSRYGEAHSTPTLDLRPERDALDMALFAEAERRAVPVFGICRGMQVVNVALGGTLWQDLASERDRGVEHEFPRNEYDPSHPAHALRCRTSAGSSFAHALAALDGATVNSRHHQAIKDLAAPLASLAASPDDVIEAVERTGGPYLAAVQWHPEDLVSQPAQKALLQSFLDACRAHALKRGDRDTPPIEVALEGRIPVIRINRPSKKNALAGTMRQMLADTIEALATDVTAPAIVITGAGGAFCSGGDLQVLRALLDAGDAHGFRELLEQGARAVLAIGRAPQPVLAAVDGAAAGAGMNLALACDVRVASSFPGSEAVFSQPFVGIGLAPDWGGSYHLPRLAGTGGAADLVFSADRISADRARELGLVDFVVPDGPALPAALARAERYSERPAAALAAAKRALNADRLPRLAEALLRETEIQMELFTSGVLAASLPRAASRESQERPS